MRISHHTKEDLASLLLTLVAFCVVMFLAIVFSTPAHADTLTWTWTPPDARTDGTPLLPEEIAGYRFMLNTIEQPNLLTGGENNLILDIPLGEQCGQFATEDTEGRLSVFTDPVCKTAKGLPGKPVSVNVTIVRPKRN